MIILIRIIIFIITMLLFGILIVEVKQKQSPHYKPGILFWLFWFIFYTIIYYII